MAARRIALSPLASVVVSDSSSKGGELGVLSRPTAMPLMGVVTAPLSRAAIQLSAALHGRCC